MKLSLQTLPKLFRKKHTIIISGFIIILCIYLLGFLSHALYLKKTVYGDGIFYYSYLRSLVFNKSIDFSNEYAVFGIAQPYTPKGVYGNKYSIGPPILWLPNYLWIYRLVRLSGYELLYQLTVGITSILYAFVALLLLFRILLRYASPYASLLAVSAIGLSTNLLFYGSVDPVNSHPLSFFSVTLFLVLLLQNPIRWFTLGLVYGLIGIIRPQDMIVGLFLIPRLFHFFPSARWWHNFFRFFVGFLIALTPQLIVWNQLYGVWWISPYLNGQEGFSFLHPHILEVLFSPIYGLFTYTPLVFLSFYAFILPWKRLSQYKMIAGLVIFFQIYIISCWSTWSQGASYGNRMFIGTLPVITLLLAIVFDYVCVRLKQLKYILFLLIGALWGINCIMIIATLLREI